MSVFFQIWNTTDQTNVLRENNEINAISDSQVDVVPNAVNRTASNTLILKRFHVSFSMLFFLTNDFALPPVGLLTLRNYKLDRPSSYNHWHKTIPTHIATYDIHVIDKTIRQLGFCWHITSQIWEVPIVQEWTPHFVQTKAERSKEIFFDSPGIARANSGNQHRM